MIEFARRWTRGTVSRLLLVAILAGGVLLVILHNPDLDEPAIVQTRLKDASGQRIDRTFRDTSNAGRVSAREGSDDRKMASFIENLKNAEVESTKVLGERVFDGRRIIEFLIDCDEFQSRLAKMNLPSLESSHLVDEALAMFDYSQSNFLFLEVSFPNHPDSGDNYYACASSFLYSKEDLVPIAGTNRHFTRTPVHEWFRVPLDSAWRYDDLVRKLVVMD